uniref:Uncharacterized protein n=2 Tax=Guillardia theta TaxID=55529 RepID=A0A7S4PM40_GUITH|mmetsp:Transcript_6678/g.23522  ORF Transcript_6678/g.23522 Transcript_6678/m.23522 type:complete len:259 (+) Transcript_6678:347-1123(+)
MWEDESWAVRLSAVRAAEKISKHEDEQSLFALLGRMLDTELKRADSYPIREAALRAVLKVLGNDESIMMVMNRMKNETWKDRASALQVLLLGAGKLPCRMDDVHHERSPTSQGYDIFTKTSFGSDETSMLSKDARSGREALPFEMKPAWIPPNHAGVPSSERQHEWEFRYRMGIDTSGFEPSYSTESSGRHVVEPEDARDRRERAHAIDVKLKNGTSLREIQESDHRIERAREQPTRHETLLRRGRRDPRVSSRKELL